MIRRLCVFGLVGLTLVGLTGCSNLFPHSHIASSTASTVPAVPAIANPPPPAVQEIAGGKLKANACVVAGHEQVPAVVYKSKDSNVKVPADTRPRIGYAVTPAGKFYARTLILAGRPAVIRSLYAVVAVPAVLAPSVPLAQLRVEKKCAG